MTDWTHQAYAAFRNGGPPLAQQEAAAREIARRGLEQRIEALHAAVERGLRGMR